MDKAFVLINTDMGSEKEVTKSLKEIEEVKEVYSVYGIYDLVIRVEAESMKQLKGIISMKIRHLKNVRSTLTMIVIE